MTISTPSGRWLRAARVAREHADGVASRDQEPHHVRAERAGSTGDEDHDVPPAESALGRPAS